MPAPIGLFDNPVTGYLGFCAVKFVGYSFAARVFFRDRYPECQWSAFAIGGTRTLIGMAAVPACLGLVYAGCMFLDFVGLGGLIDFVIQFESPVGYFAILFVLRLAEWWLLIWLFYDRKFQNKRKGWTVALLGTAWSFVLDLPATIAYFMTGGWFVLC